MDTITKFRSAVGDRHKSDPAVNPGAAAKEVKKPSLAADHEIPDTFLDASYSEFRAGSSNHQQGLREMQVSLHAYSKAGRGTLKPVLQLEIGWFQRLRL